MSRIRIVRLVPVLDFGGVESRVVLQSALMDRERYDFRVCTFWKDGGAAAAVRKNGIPVDVLNVDPAVRNPMATLALKRYLQRVQPDILHASISEGIYHAAIAGALSRVPVRIVEEVGIPSRGALGRRVYGALYHTVDAVIGVAQATCDILQQEGAPNDRLRLVYNCAAPAFFPDSPVAPDYTGHLRILAVGRLVAVKNHKTLLRAFARILRDHPDATLSIAGDGPLRAQMDVWISELDIAQNVTMLGFRDDVRQLLLSHNCFVLPSWTEGCSISLIEAMASGLCVVGSTASGIAEVMGRQGLVPPDSVDKWAAALTTLARSTAEQREAIGRQQQRIAYARFSPATYLATLTELYENLVAHVGDREAV